MPQRYEKLRKLSIIISEIPLHTEGGVDEESLIVEGVINEIVADFNFGAYTEVVGDIIPQLRLGEDDELAVTIGLLSTPEIDEARERHFAVEEMNAPHTCELHAIVGCIEIVALEETLIEQLE